MTHPIRLPWLTLGAVALAGGPAAIACEPPPELMFIDGVAAAREAACGPLVDLGVGLPACLDALLHPWWSALGYDLVGVELGLGDITCLTLDIEAQIGASVPPTWPAHAWGYDVCLASTRQVGGVCVIDGQLGQGITDPVRAQQVQELLWLYMPSPAFPGLAVHAPWLDAAADVDHLAGEASVMLYAMSVLAADEACDAGCVAELAGVDAVFLAELRARYGVSPLPEVGQGEIVVPEEPTERDCEDLAAAKAAAQALADFVNDTIHPSEVSVGDNPDGLPNSIGVGPSGRRTRCS